MLSLSPIIREILPEDVESAIDLLTRAFANDPCCNHFGRVRTPNVVTDLSTKDYGPAKTLQCLRVYEACLLRSSIDVGATVMVAVDPETEQVLGVAMWMPPGKGMDFPVTTLIKCGAVQAVLAWGPGALKRIFADFVPRSEEAKTKAFAARGKDTKDCWYLLQFAVDPSAQGRGVGSRLMADGIARAGRRPLHLEASSPKSRDIYLHFGCELDEEVIIGQGAVDAKGVVARSYADATGYPLYVMTKWNK